MTRAEWFTESDTDPYERDHQQRELDGPIRGMVSLRLYFLCLFVGAFFGAIVWFAS